MRLAFVLVLGAGVLLALAAPASSRTLKQCNADYAAEKAELKAAGTGKADFIAACRARAAAAAPVEAAPARPAPADPMAPKPLMSAAEAAPIAPAPPTAVAGIDGGVASREAAQARCPSDTIVWVNAKTGLYRVARTRPAKHGAFMCEADARAAGARAADERRP
jgi:hypothetical protein